MTWGPHNPNLRGYVWARRQAGSAPFVTFLLADQTTVLHGGLCLKAEMLQYCPIIKPSEPDWKPMTLNCLASEQMSPIEGIDMGDCWTNGLYTAHVRTDEESGAKHISIKRVDKEPCHDWRDFQRIKNDICGPEWEAIEIYPAMSRLVDSSNQYHLWCFPEGIGIGFSGRFTTSETGVANTKQRPLPADWEEVIPDEIRRTLGL